jgi:hypothetical protein
MSRRAGFRFSIVDGLFIAALGIAFAFLRKPLGPAVWVIPFAAGHFFLFCNVFRVRRTYELAWVALFFVNTGAWAAAGHVNWLWILASQAPVTIAAIVLEMRSRAYHGVFAGQLNPNLKEWSEGS